MSEKSKKTRELNQRELESSKWRSKVPPNDNELEVVVLGTIMLEREAITIAMDKISVETFYSDKHRIIYDAILKVHRSGEPIDILTVTQFLRKTEQLEGVGGAYYITQMTNRVASSANLEFHCMILLQLQIKRDITGMQRFIEESYDPSTDIFDLLDHAQSFLNDVTGKVIKGREKYTSELFGDFMKRVEASTGRTEKFTGVPSSIIGIDKVTKGWQNTDLVIIAGRPSMGKSAILKACIKGCTHVFKKPVLVFSIETSAPQLIDRLMSEDVGVDSSAFTDGSHTHKTNMNAMNSAVTHYFDDKQRDLLIIDDSATMTINELRAKAKRIVKKTDAKLIVVDYLNLIKGSNNKQNERRDLEIGEITKGLKSLAKELGIPVIALCQIGRASEQNTDLKPRLSNLRESGEIENHADLVILLHRPEYYYRQGIEKYATIMTFDGREICSRGYAEAIIAKHRNGSTETVPLKFTGFLTQFKDWDGIEQSYEAQANVYQGSALVQNPDKNIEANKDFLDQPFT